MNYEYGFFSDLLSTDPGEEPPDAGRRTYNPHNDAVAAFEAATERPVRVGKGSKQQGPSDFQVLIAMITRMERAHPVRMHRLRRDLAWLQQKARKKYGIRIFS